MTHAEAERWCEDRELRCVKFPLPAVKEHGIPAREGWDVSGWGHPKDKAKAKVRIHEIGASLVEAVQKAKIKYDAIVA